MYKTPSRLNLNERTIVNHILATRLQSAATTQTPLFMIDIVDELRHNHGIEFSTTTPLTKYAKKHFGSTYDIDGRKRAGTFVTFKDGKKKTADAISEYEWRIGNLDASDEADRREIEQITERIAERAKKREALRRIVADMEILAS